MLPYHPGLQAKGSESQRTMLWFGLDSRLATNIRRAMNNAKGEHERVNAFVISRIVLLSFPVIVLAKPDPDTVTVAMLRPQPDPARYALIRTPYKPVEVVFLGFRGLLDIKSHLQIFYQLFLSDTKNPIQDNIHDWKSRARIKKPEKFHKIVSI